LQIRIKEKGNGRENGKEKTEMIFVIREIVIYLGKGECAQDYGISYDIIY
jgi:hypothetical protein